VFQGSFQAVTGICPDPIVPLSYPHPPEIILHASTGTNKNLFLTRRWDLNSTNQKNTIGLAGGISDF
jgi:hypothetical protein